MESDDESSVSETSVSDNNKSVEEELIKDESHAVNRTKLIVYLALLLATGIVGSITYILLKKEEENTMRTEFTAKAAEILHHEEKIAHDIIRELHELSIAITSYTHDVSCAWPNCTIPDFDMRTQSEFTIVELIGFVPLVPASEKAGWEAYASANQGWIAQDLENRGWEANPGKIPSHIHSFSDLELPEIDGGGGQDHVHRFRRYLAEDGDEPSNVPSIYLPLWQFSPVPSDTKLISKVNIDLLTHSVLGPNFLKALEKVEVIQTETFPIVTLTGEVSDDHPRSCLIYPVFNKFGQGAEIVGFVASVLSWDAFLVDMFDESTIQLPVIVQVEEACGQNFHYKIPDANHVFGGYGNLQIDSSLASYKQSEVILHVEALMNDEGQKLGKLREDKSAVENDGGHEEENEVHREGGHEEEHEAPHRLRYLAGDESHKDAEKHSDVESEHETRKDMDGSAHEDHCFFTLHVTPSKEFKDAYSTNKPLLYSGFVVLIFLFTAAVFLVYDVLVSRRQKKLLLTARRTNAIVASLFPKDVQKRILQEAEEQAAAESKDNRRGPDFSTKSQMNDFITKNAEGSSNIKPLLGSKPLADFFPEATVLFADIAGFTAWSSTREPCQVFLLLETVYGEFDSIAKRRRIFKVETIGDCYVAACGLPVKRRDHAVVMARFASDCLEAFNRTVRELEVTLGPDTSDLALRIGIHSGPVTAGVLRGEKARFQLFGDTVNTCACIETSGAPNKIHLSEEAAELVVAAGKGRWLTPREDKVQAKGKGELTTYWLEMKGKNSDSASSASGSNATSDEIESASAFVKGSVRTNAASSNKCTRLIDWNTDMLSQILKQIAARRQAQGILPTPARRLAELEASVGMERGLVLDEVQETITLPHFDQTAVKRQPDIDTIELKPEAVSQLWDYVYAISSMYRDNPFHNFEHASHVCMSVSKLLSRIVAPALEDVKKDKEGCNLHQNLHDHTYGITSDPLTQFVCSFSALIHDVDHQGVPNTQLIKEKTPLATAYQDKSVAEQNSVDIAWHLLMQDHFIELRRAIYTTESEFLRFRQLVVNSVMATDIMDKSLKMLRNARWDKAFAASNMLEGESISNTADDINRKATIVIEHLIQASDVAHTMQHWHVYRKWNERLFTEMYRAYKQGRSEVNPADGWYKGEMGFYDFYIIPLAKKLKDCGVFGVSSDEYLKYAESNRREWEAKGESVVDEMLEKISQMEFAHQPVDNVDGVDACSNETNIYGVEA